MPAAVAIPIITGAMGAGAAVYGANKQSAGARAAAASQASTANYAADLESKAAADQLTFAKQQEAERQAEWQKTQGQNQSNYLADVARQQGNIDAKVGRLSPYINWGYGSIGQLMQPTPNRPGSLRSRIGG